MADPLSDLREALTAYLREDPLLEGISVSGEYPGGYRGAPPRKSRIAVGIAGVERPAAPQGRVKLTMRFGILCPAGAGSGCHSVFERLCGALFCRENTFGITEIHCGKTGFDPDTGCLTLDAEAVLPGLLWVEAPAQGEPFGDIIIRAKEV